MTERRGDPGFTVAPRRLGDDPGRRGPRRGRPLGIAVVLGAAAAIFLIAFMGPRLSGRPNLDIAFFATPTPATTPTPEPSRDATPIPTPGVTTLPEITRPDGVGQAEGRVAIGADGMRVLDLGSGTIEAGTRLNPGRDALVRGPGGVGWTCVCFIEDFVDESPARRIRIASLDENGAVVASKDIATLKVTYPSEFGNDDPTTDVDIGIDGRGGLLAIATRVENTWRFKITAIDVVGLRAGPTVELGMATIPVARPGRSPAPSSAPAPTIAASPGAGTTPAPTPDAPPNYFLDGPHVRIAPSGRVAFVWGIVHEANQDMVTASAVRAWRVEIDEGGGLGAAAPIAGLADLPSFCSGVGFAGPDRLAWLCPLFPTDPNGVLNAWQIGAIDLAGQLRASREIPAVADGWYGEPLFDRANGLLYAWDPMTLTLIRVDVETLDMTTVAYDPAAGSGPGVAPAGGEPPAWRDADSAVQLFSYPQIAAAPNGSRLYLLGFDRFADPQAMTQKSLGVFVVDRATLALVDRWAPAATYVALSVMPNGQVLGMGLPGADTDGHEAPWQGSLTVHDPSDGRILVRFGQLGQDSPPLAFDR